MTRDYPRVCDRIPDEVLAETCELCDDKARATVRVEYNADSGYDDVFDVCRAHQKAANVDVIAFVNEYVKKTMEEGDNNQE